jgi:hypothetical protein
MLDQPPDLSRVWLLQHWPDRPTWRCRTCGEPWPCEPARTELQTWPLLERTGVMGELFVAACSELRGWQAGELHDRFLGWLR